MNRESLCNLPSLVNSMDENLSINISDFIKNPIFSELHLDQAQIIALIKSSNKFHYDTKTSLIKFKEKADRNILIIGNYVMQCEKIAKEEFITKLIGDLNINYVSKIKKIDLVGDSFHVVFQNEDISMDVEKYIFNMLEEKKNEESNKYFSDLKSANICLAAESLKRRVLSNLVNNPLWKQTQLVSKIIGSMLHRRNTAAINNHIILRRDSEGQGNNQNSLNYQFKSKFSENLQNINYTINKQNYVTKGHSKTIHHAHSLYRDSSMLQNLSNRFQHRNSKVLHNKFDVVTEEVNPLSSVAPNTNYNTALPLNSRKVSFRDNLAVNAISDYMKIPLNKEYEVDMENKIDTEISDANGKYYI